MNEKARRIVLRAPGSLRLKSFSEEEAGTARLGKKIDIAAYRAASAGKLEIEKLFGRGGGHGPLREED